MSLPGPPLANPIPKLFFTARQLAAELGVSRQDFFHTAIAWSNSSRLVAAIEI
jgi:hypothetical protein